MLESLVVADKLTEVIKSLLMKVLSSALEASVHEDKDALPEAITSNASAPVKSTVSKNPKSKDVSAIKIEISCPECARQLRIPQGYSGTVKCPDCAKSFEVDEPAEEIEEEEEIVETPNDGKIEISCPDCSQSLRIPSSYEGSVRCPSCKTIFKSTDSEV